MIKIQVLNGPNLQLLGRREPAIYGTRTLDDIEQAMAHRASELGVEVAFFQSNHEGDLVDKIGECLDTMDGIIMNPAAYTHTSVALRDALKAVEIPAVEVHLSNISEREAFRHRSITAGVCMGQIAGFGSESYLLALDGLVRYIQRHSD
jgi:3-dehydroquinate dehydratase-2